MKFKLPFGKSKSAIQSQYFARIDPGTFDINTENVSEIINQTGQLAETWPEASFADLQQFLSQLVNDLVRPTGEDIHLTSIVYFIQEQQGKKTSKRQTGVSWDQVTLNADFQNFLVGTADQLFNDETLRMDETVTYDMLVEALEPLMTAAVDDNVLSEADLPALPSIGEFKQARETNAPIKIMAERLNFQPVDAIETENEKDSHPVSASVHEHQLSVADSQPYFEDNDDAPTVSETHPESAVLAQSHDNIPIKATSDDTPLVAAPKSYNEAPHVQVAIDLAADDLQAPLFEVSRDNQAIAEVPITDQHYVDQRLNLAKQAANQKLQSQREHLWLDIRENVLKRKVDAEAELIKRVTSITETDWQSDIEQELLQTRDDKLEQRLEEAKNQINEAYQLEISQENDRHESAIATINRNHSQQLASVSQQVSAEVSDWFNETFKTAMASQQAQISEKASETRLAGEKQIAEQCESQRIKMLQTANEQLLDMFKQEEQAIEAQRATLVKEQQDFLTVQSTFDANQLKAESLVEKDEQIRVLEQKHFDAAKQRDALMAQTQDLRELLKQTQEALQAQRLVKPDSKQSDDDASTLLKAILAQQMQPAPTPSTSDNTEPVKQHNGWRNAFLGLVACGGLIIAGTGGYFAAQTNHHGVKQTAKKQTTQQSVSEMKAIALPSAQTSSQTSHSETQASSSSQKDASKVTKDSENTSQSKTTSPYRVGQLANVTINGMAAQAPITSVTDDGFVVTYQNQDYFIAIGS